jgi:hypothetical protein
MRGVVLIDELQEHTNHSAFEQEFFHLLAKRGQAGEEL